jgi:hypothetical protein
MFASGGISALSAAYLWRKPGAVGRTGLAACLAAGAIWALAYGMEMLSTTRQAKELWGAGKYVGVCAIPGAWLVFALQYTGRERRVTGRLLATVSVPPAIVLAILANPHTRSLVRSYPSGPLGMFPVVKLGPVFWALFAYGLVVVVPATGLLVLTLLRLASSRTSASGRSGTSTRPRSRSRSAASS